MCVCVCKLLSDFLGIDIIPLICTLIACLALSIEFGILIGIGINIAFVLYNIARPNVLVYNRKVLDQEMLVLLPDQCLTFSSSDHIKSKVLKYVNRNTSSIIIIDGRYVRSIDTTVAKVIYFSTVDLQSLFFPSKNSKKIM